MENREFLIKHHGDLSLFREFNELVRLTTDRRRRAIYMADEGKRITIEEKFEKLYELEQWRANVLQRFIYTLGEIGRPGTHCELRMSHEGIESMHNWAWLSDDRERCTYQGGLVIKVTDDFDIEISSHS